MSNRKEYWAHQVLGLESSGLSRAAFCRRRGLNYQTMSAWVKRFENEADGLVRHGRWAADDEAATKDEAATDDVALADARDLPFVELPIPACAAAGYEVVLGGGRSIRIGADFDHHVLTRLIQVVDAC